ncbi:endonuclease/exonuclease/phosphatase family protein [Bifidobacterium platyrrhinorum]|uniref:Endonuclease/exonuclease/phosphatase family protein n=1 Tax=Bifidobacterium platyrrhinorum TaxID=2661628 RepID=A0A6L9SV81_9BIFI|nr:endonuclease/exonuclease/phosphatase family protein [Bifidobacterium platyrrhinorum]NEG55061.1 endonuclease/exonuclease/phosphatase family protein [Bifidobacterium platyrrhinorum]
MLVWFLWGVMLVGSVWVLLSQLSAGMEARMPFPYMIALIPFLWVPLVACAAVAAYLREWGAMCCLLAVALSASTRRIAYWGTDPHPRRETSRETHSDSRETSRETPTEASSAEPPSSLTLMTLNCRYGRADAGAIVREARDRGVDVLALQEVTDGLVARLDAAGIADLLPYRRSGEAKETDNGGYNMVFSRFEPQDSTPSAVDIPAADVPAVTLAAAGGRTVTLASAHPKSPMRGPRDWSAGIIGLGALAKSAYVGDHGTVVVLGDLNSSTDHPSFRRLLAAGFRDASLTQAKGPNLTFPRWLVWPRIELDHILATRGDATFSHVSSFVVPDTDHLALTARIGFKG